ncbi:MAG: AMP-binding protein [Candidatus Aminicenantes bacterium]|nr:MAG: AMP-binding protein [Candidatus Aminicenantes bacterium]
MIIERFEQHVKKSPDKLAIKSQDGSLTYNELNTLSNRIANKIKTLSEVKGSIGVLVDDGGEMIASILGVLKSGNIYVPITADFPEKRIHFIIHHAEISVFITDNKNKNQVLNASNDKKLQLIILEEIETRGDSPGFTRDICSDSEASLLYTSGSTGIPKGVPQTHRNILYFIDRYTENLGITSADRLTLLASFTHDVTLLDMYSGLLSGAALFPLDLKTDGALAAFPQWLKNEKITIWHSVPTVFRYFTAGLEGKPQPVLPHLRRVVLGGESVLQTDIEKFNSFFSNCHHCQLYILYGQTESSYNSGQFNNLGEPVTAITLGDVNKGTRMYVVDEEGNEADLLEVGEIIVINNHLSPGYWKDEKSTREKFIENPEEGRIYFTGDLGRELLDSRIEFVGRKDNQIKLRGYRIELEEIEQLVMQFNDITGAAVTAIETSSQERFIACYFVGRRDIDLRLLREFLAQRLVDYMVPSYFKQIRKLPMTVSGKIDRKALPAPEVAPGHEYVPPHTPLENQLVEIWSDILDLGREVIGTKSNFFQLGGHSLRATALTAKIQTQLQAKIPLLDVFERPTIKELAGLIAQTQKNRHTGIQPVEKKEYYPLSCVQQRLYQIQQQHPQDTTYNMPYFFTFEFTGTRESLENVFKQLIRRYEVFRTTFAIVDQKPVQRVHEYETVEFSIDYIETSPGQASDSFKNFIAPFDLSRVPLFRVAVLRIKAINLNKSIIIFDFHHIITDNISSNLLEKDCMAFADGKQLPGLKLHYKDYAWWQSSTLQQGALNKQEEYWLKIFAGNLPVLELPYDYPVPSKQGFEGSNLPFLLGIEETKRVKEFVKETGTTFFTVAFSAFNLLLAKLCHQEDIVVGTPIAVRDQPELQDMIGILINTLPQRNYPTGNKTVKEFLKEVKQHALEVFENQAYPYEELVNKLSLEWDTCRNPLFDVMFNLVDERLYQGDPSTMSDQDIYLSMRDTSRYDLGLIAVDRGSNILFRFEYSTRLFSRERIKRMIGHYKKILISLPGKGEEKLEDIEI